MDSNGFQIPQSMPLKSLLLAVFALHMLNVKRFEFIEYFRPFGIYLIIDFDLEKEYFFQEHRYLKQSGA